MLAEPSNRVATCGMIKQMLKYASILSDQERATLRVLQVLADETRYKMYKLLRNRELVCVGEIARLIGVSIPAISQHFKLFEAAGMVDRQRFGQRICYSLRDELLLSSLKGIVD